MVSEQVIVDQLKQDNIDWELVDEISESAVDLQRIRNLKKKIVGEQNHDMSHVIDLKKKIASKDPYYIYSN